MKIYSNVTGYKVYLDDEYEGMDVVEIPFIDEGEHHVFITKDDAIYYSEDVMVFAGLVTPIPLPDKPLYKMQEKPVETLTREQQGYKDNKLAVINVTDGWILTKGGQRISDREFASLVGDKNTMAAIDKDMKEYYDTMDFGDKIMWGAAACIGVGMLASGSPDKTLSGVMLIAGLGGALWGMNVYSAEEPSGHYISSPTAAQQAQEYNRALKNKLGLSESYEPK
jgi:hypothetical protein